VKPLARKSAFSLIELLVVIAIIGILAAISMPVFKNLRATDAMAASTRQLLDDVARARQYAISQRTTVYMIFCPQDFWNDPAFAALSPTEKVKAAKLYGKQLTAYAFVTLRSVGEQPGQISPRYLSPWHVMPDGAVIPSFKFFARNFFPAVQDPPLPATANRIFRVAGFSVTNNIPFPSSEVYAPGRTYVSVPYLAFDFQGKLVSGVDEYIPLARGSVSYTRNAHKSAAQSPPTVAESPAGNSTNAFSLVHIDWLTGRARLEKQEFP
jgi:prepilin-type N-terminal cleavage/methylation domain-containing protein